MGNSRPPSPAHATSDARRVGGSTHTQAPSDTGSRHVADPKPDAHATLDSESRRVGETLSKWNAAQWQEWKDQRLEREVDKIVEEARASQERPL